MKSAKSLSKIQIVWTMTVLAAIGFLSAAFQLQLFSETTKNSYLLGICVIGAIGGFVLMLVRRE